MAEDKVIELSEVTVTGKRTAFPTPSSVSGATFFVKLAGWAKGNKKAIGLVVVLSLLLYVFSGTKKYKY